MSAEVTAGRGDVGGAAAVQQADGEVAQGRHDSRAVSGSDLGQVLAVGDVADPVQSVLDAPVPAQGVGELDGGGLLGSQVGDRVDRFGAPPAAGQRPAAAGDLKRQPGVREADSSADRGEFEGALLASAMGPCRC